MIHNPYIFVKINNQKRDLAELEDRSNGSILWNDGTLPTEIGCCDSISYVTFCNNLYDNIDLEELFRHMTYLPEDDPFIRDIIEPFATEKFESVGDFLDKYFCDVDDLGSVTECEVFDLL